MRDKQSSSHTIVKKQESSKENKAVASLFENPLEHPDIFFTTKQICRKISMLKHTALGFPII